MSEFFEKRLGGERVYDGKILSLRRDAVLLPNGKTATREIVDHKGGSGVLAINDGKVLLVKQFRYAVGETIYEIPAGKSEKGESPEKTAARELQEECGLIAEDLRLLTEILPTPGYSSEHIYVYVAEKFRQGKTRRDEGEFLEIGWVDFGEALQMVFDGKIKDAKTEIALLRRAVGQNKK